MVFSSSKLESLSLRPPTPPKELEDSDHDVDEVLDFLQDPFGSKPVESVPIAAKLLLSTPQQSPSSDSAIPTCSANRKKRVNFDPQPCSIPDNNLAPQSFTPLRSSPLRPLPQTRVSKPLKSILKSSDAPSPSDSTSHAAPAHKYKSFADMLESITKQLALNSRPSSLDAYHSLLRTMQAYENVPDVQSLLDKMGLLTQFIMRDAQAVGINGTGLDSQLISQALKFLTALFRIPQLRSVLDDDFCTFIVDRTIQVAADASMPKSVVNVHLAVLMQQEFRPRVMTAARVERILDVLDTIHERVSGLSVHAYRIRIYRRLIQQRHETMSRHCERWVKHVVHGLLSMQKDINQSAIDTAMSAARAIGTDRQVVKSVLSILNRENKEGVTFAAIIVKEMEKILASENAIMVPQIWSSITALLPNSLRIDLFPALKDWMKVFEQCLKSTNEAVQVQANTAFGVLIYSVNIGENTPATWIQMLANVSQQQLKQRGQGKKDERAVTSGYFTLLYYAFPPTASHKQLDRYWAEFVAGFWEPLIRSSSPIHTLAACRVVSALLNGARKHPDRQRALNLKPKSMMQRDELPLLDPKWVRRSVLLILEFVELLLDATPWIESDCKDEPAKTMWLCFLDSLNLASSQEVMASTESKDAMAQIVNLLRRLWDRHATQLALSQQKEDRWANKFCFLLETVVEKLGTLQFADKCLTRNGQDEFEVASTPSSRSRQQGPRISPLIYFIDLLVNQSEGKLSDAVRLRAMRVLIEPCLSSQKTRLNRLEMLRDCASTVNLSSKTPVTAKFWAQLATMAKDYIKEQPLDSNERASRQLGKEFEVAVEVLSLGSSHLVTESQGQEVLKCLVDTVRCEAGEGAVVLAVIERVSECVLKRVPQEFQASCLPYITILLRNLPKTIVRRTIEQGRKNLWPAAANQGRTHDFDPYNHFYDALVWSSSAVYRGFEEASRENMRDFLAAFATSIHQCPMALLAVFLRKVQEAVRIWVEDPDRKLQNKDQQIKNVQCQVVYVWKEVCAAVERLPRKDSQILLHLEPLITAGFLSRRRAVVNMSIATWNTTFGKQETLRYPLRLEQALRRLRATVELTLPSLEGGDDLADGELSFYESDDSTNHCKAQLRSPRVNQSPFRVRKTPRKSRSPASSRRSSRKTSAVRLRHNDSQIHFEPILSSADPFNDESQLLTERQKEMVERQVTTANLFATMGSTSSPSRGWPTRAIRSPLDISSDGLSAEDLPIENARTPLNNLQSLGPMDVFVGSSPTPRARNRAPEVVDDHTSVATPTAVRSVQLDDNVEELGSSPPRFEKSLQSNSTALGSTDLIGDFVGDSFEYGQPAQPYNISFDEGSTIDENGLPEAEPASPTHHQATEDPMSRLNEEPDTPSSTTELQLEAQIDADIQAHLIAVSSKESEEAADEPATVVVDATAHQIQTQAAESGSDMEARHSEVVISTQSDSPMLDANSGSISGVGNSFSSQVSETSSSKISALRRSARHSATASPVRPVNGKKRRGTSGNRHGRSKKSRMSKIKVEAEEDSFISIPSDDQVLDNIIVESPEVIKAKASSRHNSQTLAEGEAEAPETSRKRGARRSDSSLAEPEDAVVEQAPTRKRLRGSSSQASPRGSSQGAQVKRLSHVRVTPKRTSETASSSRQASVVVEEKAAGDQLASVGEQNGEVARHAPDEPTAPSQPQHMDTPRRSFAERVILTPRSIINQLKSLKDALFRSSQLVLGREEEREISGTLIDIMSGVHAAGGRRENV